MRKRVLVVLALMVCLLAQMVPVFAAGELSEADLVALPKPGADVKLISSTNLNKHADGTFGFQCNEGDIESFAYMYDKLDCKIITYVPSRSIFMTNTPVQYTSTDEFTGEVYVTDTLEYKEFNTFSAALDSASVIVKGDWFDVKMDVDSYIVFVNSKTNEPEFCCRPLELKNHVYEISLVTDVKEPSVSLVTVDKVINDSNEVTGAVVRLTYSLPGFSKSGVLVEEFGSSVTVVSAGDSIDLPSRTSNGSFDFTLNGLSNGTYTVWLWTDQGNRYSTEYVVDFITGSSGSGGLQFTPYDGSFSEPVVRVEGLPTGDELASVPLELRLISDTPVLFRWAGVAVSSEYLTEVSVVVSSNGVYSFDATSEVGKVHSGSVTITNLPDGVDMNGFELVDSTAGLVQTGVEHSGVFYYGVVAVVGLIILAIGVFYVVKRKGVESK